MKKYNAFAVAIILMLTLISCEKKVASLSLSHNSLTLYVGDTEILLPKIEPANASSKSLKWASDNEAVATVSANGRVTALDTGRTTISLAVQGHTAGCILTVSPDVYVAGYEKNSQGKQVATLWKNGKPHRLGNEQKNTTATSVFVLNEDIYVAGTGGDFGAMSALLWKNGEIVGGYGYGTGGFNVGASSVFAYGDDVYVTGSATNVSGEEFIGTAALWKNNDPEILGVGQTASAHAVFVSGKNVYVVGNEGYFNNIVAMLWKNGVPQRLTSYGNGEMASADSIYVSGGDVYISGYSLVSSDKFQAILWKNGNPRTVGKTKPRPPQTSLFVVGNKVHVATCELVSGLTEFWTITGDELDPRPDSLDVHLGSIYVWEKSSDAMETIYFAGTEESDGKYYAVVGNPDILSRKIKRLTDGTHEAGANAVFVK